ncbi:hypothetical protein NECAME_17301 [Necator americanus]|uniref:Uncharacterized protein n=1 Tax=Necator americanus TaxID=51031 RepID=W2TPI0_NECAM|nr:hypothetical protein NECAME_17301 [Necator americanus]ETN83990.1 hypothetical protein NECAME_17301 [Necator americanus]
MECHKNGILVKNAKTEDFEICIEDECQLYSKPSPQELLIRSLQPLLRVSRKATANRQRLRRLTEALAILAIL